MEQNPRQEREDKKQMNRQALLLSLCAIVLLGSYPADAQEKKLDPFTISYASVSGTRGPLSLAQDLGLFEKYGLDVNLPYIASGVTSMKPLLGGTVHITPAA